MASFAGIRMIGSLLDFSQDFIRIACFIPDRIIDGCFQGVIFLEFNLEGEFKSLLE